MTRIRLVQFHLALGAFFLPFLFLMPLSGVLHLSDVRGKVTEAPAFTITDPVPAGEDAQPAFFREQFAKRGIDYKFEDLRSNGKDFTFRPTSRSHYIASLTEAGLAVKRADPSLVRRLMEIHKGHGPALMKVLEVLFGMSLILVTLSGIWLAVTVPSYRFILLGSTAAGAAVIAAALL